MKFILPFLLLFLGTAHAQTVTCPSNDFACRVQHNDAAELGRKLDVLHNDLLKLTAPAPVVTTPTPAPVATLTDPCASGAKWSTLTVNPTMNISAALACANPGFKLTLSAGVYKQVFHVPDGLSPWDIGGVSADTVKADGQGGCTVDQNNAGGCDTKLAYRKGVIHVSSVGVIHDLEVRNGGNNAQGNHDGQAGIYVDAPGTPTTGVVTIRNVMFRNNQNGLFGNANNPFDIVVENSDFVGNGTDGGSHSAYVNGSASLTLNNIQDYGSNSGNDQKSRIPIVHVNGGFFKSNQGRVIECADGCTLDVHNAMLIGNECCQNIFGNGTESTSKGPGNTTFDNVRIWVGRASAFSNAGSFNATNTTVTCGPNNGPSIFNEKGTPLTGLPGCGSPVNAPAMPAYISGAKS